MISEDADRAASVFMVGYEGISIISDIDDTIKVTGVGSIPQVLENTLVKPFKALPGMAAAYQKWIAKETKNSKSFLPNKPHIHYVSSSPWPFAGSLYEWMMREKFPPGSMHLKSFRLELFEPWGVDVTVFNLIRNPFKYKTSTISQIFRHFPGRKFVLIGDSSEKDPQIYANIAKLFPSQVACIMIRNVTNHPISEKKARDIFQGLAPGTFTTYHLGDDDDEGEIGFKPSPLSAMASSHSCALPPKSEQFGS